MPCTNCGRAASVGEFTLRFTPGSREPKVLELALCDGCLEEFLDEGDIEMLEPAIAVTAGETREL